MRRRGLRVRDQDKTLPEVPHGGETPRREHRNGAGSVVSAVRGSGLRWWSNTTTAVLTKKMFSKILRLTLF